MRDARTLHEQASEILGAIVDKPLAEQEAVIARACSGDETLEREVRSLLQHDRRDSQVDTEPGPPSDTRDMTGRIVGRYRILAELGRGGMGSAWKAEDPVLKRTVAIKFLYSTQAVSESSRRRFLREAQAASALSHPGIAAVYDYGEIDDEPYIAMQYIDGRTIRTRLQEQAIAPAEALRTAMEVARALVHAHGHGIVHRDVSPGNVMIRSDGTVLLLDFGVALHSAHKSRLSRTGELVGTIGYVAPEVIAGNDATFQSDVFNLGVVLYEMLTRYPPFTGDNPNAVLTATQNLDPEPPSHLVPGVTGDVDRIVLTALARDTATRYRSARVLADELEAVLRSGSTTRYPRQAYREPQPLNPGRKLKRVRAAVARLKVRLSRLG